MAVALTVPVIDYYVKREWASQAEPCPHVLLRRFLAFHNLFGPGFLYRGFDIARLGKVLETGTDRDSTSRPDGFASCAGLVNPEGYLNATPPIGERGVNIDWSVNEAFFNGDKGLSIYRVEAMTRLGRSNLLYAPKSGFLEALAAVVMPRINNMS